jgi:hypothetical protein
MAFVLNTIATAVTVANIADNLKTLFLATLTLSSRLI